MLLYLIRMVEVDGKTSLFWPKNKNEKVFEHDYGSGKPIFVVRAHFHHNNILAQFFSSHNFVESCWIHQLIGWWSSTRSKRNHSMWTLLKYLHNWSIDPMQTKKSFFSQKNFQKHLVSLTIRKHVQHSHTIKSIIFWNEFIEMRAILSWRKRTTTREISNLFWLL